MLRRISLGIVLCIALAVAGPGHARDVNAPASVLPAIGADGLTRPLTVDQLDPAERATYAGLVPGSADARRFLYTRGYLRYCRLVVAGKLAPRDLPELPARENWDRRFLSADEGARVVDVALEMNMATLLRPDIRLPAQRAATDRLPAVGAKGMSAPLSVGQLDPDERATYDKLAPGGADARRFLYTRGFLRFCRLVVEKRLDPLQMPMLPATENWDRQFLTADEGRNLVDLALVMQMIAMMKPPGQ